MSKEQFATAREARTHLTALGYAPTTPANMEGAICWVKPEEPGYYLVAKTTDGARLMHYRGTPEGLPAGAIVSCEARTPGGEDPKARTEKALQEALEAGREERARAWQQLLAQAGAFTREYDERRDCCVHALRFALDIPYSAAHEALSTAGRRYRSGTWDSTLMEALRTLDAKIIEGRRLDGPQSHITELVRPRGRYIVRTANHFFAVVNGVVLDTDPNPRRDLRRMWMVSP